jgi:hypothetical protein
MKMVIAPFEFHQILIDPICKWCNPCLIDHFEKKYFRIGIFLAFSIVFWYSVSKMVLVSQKASLFRNCGGAKFGDFGKMFWGKFFDFFHDFLKFEI